MHFESIAIKMLGKSLHSINTTLSKVVIHCQKVLAIITSNGFWCPVKRFGNSHFDCLIYRRKTDETWNLFPVTLKKVNLKETLYCKSLKDFIISHVSVGGDISMFGVFSEAWCIRHKVWGMHF